MASGEQRSNKEKKKPKKDAKAKAGAAMPGRLTDVQGPDRADHQEEVTVCSGRGARRRRRFSSTCGGTPLTLPR